MSLVDDHSSDNTKKWIDLYLSLPETYPINKEKMKDVSQWIAKCETIGFISNKPIKIYSEMPTPATDVFPFENQILRWMACYVVASGKQ